MNDSVPQRFLTIPQGVAVVLGVNLVAFAVLYAIGSFFFWNQYERTPLVERRFQAALENYNKDPRSVPNMLELGEADFQKGMYNEAVALYSQVLEIDPKNYRALLDLGEAYLKAEKWDRAVSALQRAIEAYSRAFEPHYDLGLAYQQLGKPQEARSELKLAYRLNPGSVDVIYQLGVVAEKLGDLKDAQFQYESCLQFDPNFRPAIEALERLKKSRGGN